MIFRRPRLALSNEGYRRWLRAQRPPMVWFLGLSEIEQEQLALLGDEHAQDLAIAMGYAIQDPQAADAGVSAAGGDLAAEETLARRLASGLAERLLAKRATPRPVTADARRTPSDAGRALFGRQPDGERVT